MNFKKRINGSWVDTPNYIHNTSTDTITTLPAVVYANGTTATVGLKGQAVQSSVPSPTSPIMPQGTGERTGNLFDKSMADLYSHSTLGQTNTWAYSTESTGTTLRIPCDANTQYTLSIGSTIGNTIFRISEVSTDDVPIEGGSGGIVCHTILNGGAINNYTFTTASDSKYILFQVNVNVITATLDTLMLNSGSTALPYEPYGYKIPISSGGVTTNVYLGEVESTRQIKKLVLTGQENWVKDSGNTYAYNISSIGSYYDSICSHYVASYSYSDVIATNNRYAAGKTILFIHDNNYSTAEDFKTYLAQQYAAGTPVTVWYVLATPTTGIVNEPLMKLGDYADSISGISIPTTAGDNTLDVDTTVAPSEVTATFNGWHPVTSAHERESGAWT